MEYIVEIAWLCLWPVVIYLGLKVSVKNILKFEQKIMKEK
jgi:hypothetical protein